MRWTVNPARSTAFYDTIDDLLAIHGHAGTTQVVWVDSHDETDGTGIRLLRLVPSDPRGEWAIHVPPRWGRSGGMVCIDTDELTSLVAQLSRFAQATP
jgi:hypothetical protein